MKENESQGKERRLEAKKVLTEEGREGEKENAREEGKGTRKEIREKEDVRERAR